MSFVIDAREACKRQRSGKGQWTRAFLQELAKEKDIEITLVVEDHQYTDWVMSPQITVRRFSRGFLWHLAVARAFWTGDLVGTYIATTSYIVPFLVPKSIPTVVLVHDLIAFHGEPHDRKAMMIEKLTIRRVLKNARRILALSESTKTDLLAKFPKIPEEKVVPIFAGSAKDLPEKRTPDGQTILCIATLCPRKNQKRLIHAFASLPDEVKGAYKLVLCGARGWHDSDIVRLAEKTNNVEWKGHISDEDYNHLMSTCEIFALPSLYEGFGMQILDALALGVPVLTSSRGSLAEVAGEAACVVDPEDEIAIAQGLQKMLQDKAYRSTLSKAGLEQAARFTWGRTVILFLEAVDGI